MYVQKRKSGHRVSAVDRIIRLSYVRHLIDRIYFGAVLCAERWGVLRKAQENTVVIRKPYQIGQGVFLLGLMFHKPGRGDLLPAGFSESGTGGRDARGAWLGRQTGGAERENCRHCRICCCESGWGTPGPPCRMWRRFD